jgi:hypothetical protein
MLKTTAEIVDEISEQPEDFAKTINYCLRLGEYADKNKDPERQDQKTTGIINISRAELILYSADEQQEKINKAKKWLAQANIAQSIEHKRVTARIFMIREEFGKAALEWAGIADSLEMSADTTDKLIHQNRKQAKYYELYCYAKSNDDNSRQVIHTIDVMQAEGKINDDFWSKKLIELRNQLIDSSQAEK